MLRIWGRTNSVNVKKALWCIEELALPYERIDAGMQYGVVNTPEYRKMNPGPIEEWIFFDHPSGRNRIYAAMRWKAENLKLFDGH